MSLLEVIPDDAQQQIQELSGTDLLVYFKSFHWKKCLKPYLLNLPDASLRDLLLRLHQAIPDDLRERSSAPTSDMDKETLFDELVIAYKLSTDFESSVTSICGDMQRARASRDDDESGRIEVAQALDIVFVKDSPHRTSLGICSGLQKMGLVCTERLARDGTPSPFYKKNMKGLQASKLLLAFWDRKVAPTTAEGFLGRHFDIEILERLEEFKRVWSAEAVESLYTAEVREMVEFLASDKEVISPSASAGRRFLLDLVAAGTQSGDKVPAGVGLSDINTARPAAPKRSTQVPPVLGLQHSARGSEAGAELTAGAAGASSKLSSAPQGVGGTRGDVDDLSESVAGLRLPTALAKSVLISGGDEDGAGDILNEEDKSIGKLLHASLDGDFPGLQFKMQQLLLQGGPKFKELFEPLRYEVTSPKDMKVLLRYFNETQRLTWGLCHSAGLDIDPARCTSHLKPRPVFRVRPNRRRFNNLGFPPTERRAPFDISRFLSDRSVRAWVENLAARARNPHKDSADGHLARQILVVGLVLTSLLDEFHPEQILYSTVVERLVRQLLVLEMAVGREKGERSAFLASSTRFVGIGGGSAQGNSGSPLKKTSNKLGTGQQELRKWAAEPSTGARLFCALQRLSDGHLVSPRDLMRELPTLPASEARLWGAVSQHVALMKEEDGAPIPSSFGYHLGSRGDYCLLDAELAALPGPGEAATADPADILVGEYRNAISKESLLKHPSSPLPSFSNSSRVHVGALKGHYPRLIARMLESGMVTL